MTNRAHPLDKLKEFEADCASGAWDPARGNYFEWFATCYPEARVAMRHGGASAALFAPEMKRAMPANASNPARDDYGWGKIIARLNAKFDNEHG
jgi:hypothetical protein